MSVPARFWISSDHVCIWAITFCAHAVSPAGHAHASAVKSSNVPTISSRRSSRGGGSTRDRDGATGSTGAGRGTAGGSFRQHPASTINTSQRMTSAYGVARTGALPSTRDVANDAVELIMELTDAIAQVAPPDGVEWLTGQLVFDRARFHAAFSA